MSAAVADQHPKEQAPHDEHAEKPRSNLSMQGVQSVPCAWSELFIIGGKIPSRRAYHVSFVWNNEYYVHGGQDLKEGAFGDLWKLNIEFLYPAKEAHQDEGSEAVEIEGASWQ